MSDAAPPAPAPGGRGPVRLSLPRGGLASDIAVTMGLLAVLVAIFPADSMLSAAGNFLMVASMALRRRAPFVMLALITVGGVLVLIGSNRVVPGVVVVPLAAYSVARWVPGRASRLALIIGAAASMLGPIRWTGSFGPIMTSDLNRLVAIAVLTVMCAGSVLAPYAMGRRVLESVRLLEQRQAAQAEREAHTLAEQEQQLRISEARSRAQIARELHDIVAHSLSVMIVQAEGGRALAAKRPEAALEALDTIAESGREALSEMRRIVAVLRGSPTEDADYSPTPGLGDIPDLVARSGVRAELRVIGDPPHVPQTLGLTAFRVVQEALTNVLRHAGPGATASVTLTHERGRVRVDVSDDGRGADAASDGHGTGLRGMRERVEAMGGRLTTGPRPEGGFLVRAELPFVPTPPNHSAPDHSWGSQP